MVWVECDGLLTRCDALTVRGGVRDDATTCATCRRLNPTAAAAADVERVSLADYAANNDELPASIEHARERPGEPPLVDIVSPSFQRILGAQRPPRGSLSDDERTLLTEFLENAAVLDAAMPAFLDDVKPNAILALNGKYFAEALVLAAAAEREIPIWSYERGARERTVYLDRGVAIPYPTQSIVAALEDTPLTADEREVIDGHLDARAAHRAGPELPPEIVDAERNVVLFTNLIWDSAVVEEDTLFDSMFDWMTTVIDQIAEQPDTTLTIRVHPAEDEVYWHPTHDRTPDVLARRYPDGLPANVTVFPATHPVSSYDLIDHADLVLVYASTVGMEAAVRGRRVVCAARSHYSDAPFVVRPENREAFASEVEKSALPPEGAAELAKRYLYRLYFDRMVDVPAVDAGRSDFTIGRATDAEAHAALVARLEELAEDARQHAESGVLA